MSDGWAYAIEAEEVEEEDVMPADVNGTAIAIYNIDGKYYATDDLCTHGAASLSEGIVIDEVIECPLHQGRFCVRTGKALSAPVSAAVKTYPAKVEGGKVYVQLGDG